MTMRTGWLGAVLAMTVMVAAQLAAAQPWYVALDGGAPNDGQSWATAFTNVQHAIDAAAAGDTIYLAAETFEPPANTTTGRIVWAKSLYIRGGYAKDGAPGNLSGENTRIVNTDAASAEANRLLTISGVNNSLLSRVTVVGGRINTQNSRGAGAYIINADGLTLSDCVFEDNQSTSRGQGGALGIVNSPDVTFTSCVFTRNQAPGDYTYGGAINSVDSTIAMTDCRFERNATGSSGNAVRGGAIHFQNSNLSITNSVFLFNTSAFRGGAIQMVSGTLNLWNCLLYGNFTTTLTGGAGLHVENGTATIKHSTLASQNGEGIRRSNGAVTIRDSILWGNQTDAVGSMTINDSNVGTTSGAVTLNDCISVDPLFEYGFYLHPDSPCVDAGSMTAAAAGLDGRTTRIDGTPDSGDVDLGYHYPSGFSLTYADIYVANDGDDDDNSGLAENDAFATIGKALSVARDGSRIHIAAGDYTKDTGESFPLVLTEKVGVQILGEDRATTIVDAAGVSPLTGNGGVFRLSFLGGTTRFEDLTLTGASFTANGSNGGGMYLTQASDFRMTSCTVTNNTTTRDSTLGGGLYFINSTVSIAGSDIVNNQTGVTGGAPSGGGIYQSGGRLAIHDSTIANNATSASGGGISVVSSGILELDRVRVFANTTRSGQFGGGLNLNGASALVRNSLFYDNSAGTGDGIRNQGGTTVIENCTFADNNGQGIYRSGGTVTAHNSILWGNGTDAAASQVGTLTLNVCNVENPDTETVVLNDCLSSNPLFVDAEARNYRLTEDSTSVNAGVFQSWMTDAVDLDGNPRIDNDGVDLGCYEYQFPLRIVNLPPTEVDTESAKANASLISLGPHDSVDLFVHWGPENKEADWDEWAYREELGAVESTGNYAATLTFPGGSMTYYYAFAAKKGEDVSWAQPSERILLEEVSVIATEPNASELGPVPGTYTVYRSDAATEQPLTVYFSLAGTADNGVDYELIDPASVTIAVGETSATVSIMPIIDRLREGDKTVILTIEAGGYLIGTPASAEVTIAGWEPPPVICVYSGGAGTYATNWATAFPDIQQALDSAAPGDTIYIAAETFYPPVNAANGRLVWQTSEIEIRGGGDITGEPGDLAEGNTIIANTASASAEANRLLFINGVTNSLLSRVTLTGGRINTLNGRGAGASIIGAEGLTLSECVFENNESTDQGRGGALGLQDCVNLTIESCEFTRNLTSGWNDGGGAIYAVNSTVTLNNSMLRYNRTNTRGGAIQVVSGTVDLWNCLLYGNWTSPYTGGSFPGGTGILVDNGTLTLSHSTLTGHVGEAIRRAGGAVSVTNSILWGNLTDAVGTMTIDHSNVGTTSGAVTLNDCLSVDPLFEYGFYLHPDSPCVDAGSMTAAAAGLDGRTTRIDGTPDSGDVDLGYHYPAGFSLTYADIYVSNDGDDDNGGTAENDAFATVGKALSVARDGSRIHTAAGNYTKDTGESFPLIFADRIGVRLLGADRDTTIIDAAGVSQPSYSQGGVFRLLRLGGTTGIENLTIRGGRTGSNSDGGGIYLLDGGDVRIAACIITDNRVQADHTRGGGLFSERSRVSIEASSFHNNWTGTSGSAPNGGGIYQSGGSLTIRDASISHNRTSYTGGGICVTGGCVLHLDRVKVFGNSALWNGIGGGLYLNGAGAALRNSLFYGNSAGTGAGIHNQAGTTVLENCTVADNSGHGLNRSGGSVTVHNSILWGNDTDVTGTLTAHYSNIGTGTYTAGDGCISSDPFFLDPGNDDYQLRVQGELSPSIDAGNPVADDWMRTGVDLAGNPRILNDRVDQGAYENLVPPKGSLILLR